MKQEKELTRKLMVRVGLAMLVILVLITPLLYWLTTRFYAEDLIGIVRSYGIKDPDIDLNKDVLIGVFIQFFIIVGATLAAILVVMKFMPEQLWRPFRETLRRIREFRVEKGGGLLEEHTGVKEFSELNHTLNDIMRTTTHSYNIQKEFTENASHELQTPLAIVLNKIENLLQDNDLTEHQAMEMQDMQQVMLHISRLSRSLLLLSKIDNQQYSIGSTVNIQEKMEEIIPQLKTLAGDIAITTNYQQPTLEVACNTELLRSLITNLVVNAVRHNRPGGDIGITIANDSLTVSNSSDEPALDTEHIYSRFYRSRQNMRGNGLGLPIVKSICNFHHWTIDYHYRDHRHIFEIQFIPTHL